MDNERLREYTVNPTKFTHLLIYHVFCQQTMPFKETDELKKIFLYSKAGKLTYKKQGSKGQYTGALKSPHTRMGCLIRKVEVAKIRVQKLKHLKQ